MKERNLLHLPATRRPAPIPADGGAWCGLVGESGALGRVVAQIKCIAPSDASVLIQGESGVGKELVAGAIHRNSGRQGEFVALNCGAVAPELLASELFGHERGSFTGAGAKHIGYFEQARGGTLFLDEITEMPLHLQVHLLRALENKTVRRVGGGLKRPPAASDTSPRAPAMAFGVILAGDRFSRRRGRRTCSEGP